MQLWAEHLVLLSHSSWPVYLRKSTHPTTLALRLLCVPREMHALIADGRFNLLVVLTGGSKLNYYGTQHWVDATGSLMLMTIHMR